MDVLRVLIQVLGQPGRVLWTGSERFRIPLKFFLGLRSVARGCRHTVDRYLFGLWLEREAWYFSQYPAWWGHQRVTPELLQERYQLRMSDERYQDFHERYPDFLFCDVHHPMQLPAYPDFFFCDAHHPMQLPAFFIHYVRTSGICQYINITTPIYWGPDMCSAETAAKYDWAVGWYDARAEDEQQTKSKRRCISSDGYSPTSPCYSPTSPCYSPTSPDYSGLYE